MKGQYPGVPQPWPREQSGYNNMQLQQQQQQMMYKQLQELQRQQHLPQADQDLKSHSSINPFSVMPKKIANDQLLASYNGIPLQTMPSNSWQNDFMGVDPNMPNSFQMFTAGNMNIAHQNGPSTMQSIPNGLIASHGQDQSQQTMGFPTGGLNQSLYGMPISDVSRSSQKQPFQLHEMPHDFSAIMSKAGENEAEKLLMQSTAFNTPCTNQSLSSANNFTQSFVSGPQQTLEGRNLFRHIPTEPTGFVGNFQQANPLARNVQAQKFSGRQDHTDHLGNFHEKKAQQVLSSQGSVGLDPTEQKILFSDDEVWDASFGGHGSMFTGGMIQGNFMVANSSTFPSIQSGSWSALMQSAVAETSCSDAGLQDEWSGFDFHKTEPSVANYNLGLCDSGKIQSSWFGSNLMGASSSTSRHIPAFGDGDGRTSKRNSAGFQQLNKEGVWTGQLYEKADSGIHSSENKEISPQVTWANERKMASNTISGQMNDMRFARNDNNSQSSGCEPFLKFSHSESSMQHVRMNNSTENSHENNIWESNGSHPPVSLTEPESCFQHRNEASLNNIATEINSNCLSANEKINCQGPQEYEPGCEKHVMHNSLTTQKEHESVVNHLLPRESFPIWESSTHGNDLQRHTKGKEEMHARGNVAIHDSKVYASESAISQNMLQLLHKVDNSRDFRNTKQFDSSVQSSSSEIFRSVPNESAIHREHSQASNSQSCGLQLAPPSQRLSASNNALSSNPSSQSIISGISDRLPSLRSQTPSHKNFQGRQAIVSGQTSSEIMDPTMRSSPFSGSTSRPHYERNQLQNLQISRESGTAVDQSAGMPFGSQLDPKANSRYSSHLQQKNDSDHNNGASQCNRVSPFRLPTSPDSNMSAVSQPLSANYSVPSPKENTSESYVNTNQQLPVRDMRPVSQPSLTSVISRNGGFSSMLHNVWTNISAQRLSQKTTTNTFQSDNLNNLDAPISIPQNAEDQDYHKCGVSSDSCAYPAYAKKITDKQQQSQGNNRQQGLPGMTDRDSQMAAPQLQHFAKHGTGSGNHNVGAYGQIQNQKYSLLQQVQAMKMLEARRANEKLKAAELSVGSQQMIDKSPQNFIHGFDNIGRGQTNADLSIYAAHHNSLPPDSKMLSFVSDRTECQKVDEYTQVNKKEFASQNLGCAGQTESQTLHCSAITASSPLSSLGGMEHVHGCSEIVPSGFQFHGASKSGSFEALYNDSGSSQSSQKTQQVAPKHYFAPKATDNVLTDHMVEMPDSGQDKHAWRSASTATTAKEQSSTLQAVASEVVDNGLFMRHKRRKLATIELIPWHKEIEQTLNALQTISMAELDWITATNRLIKKVEHEFEMRDGEVSVPRARRRLNLTTRLMQRVLPPVPARIFSEPAPAVYETVTYLVAKLALGSACTTLSFLANDNISGSTKNQHALSAKFNTSEKEGDQYILKVTENYLGKAKKLEECLVRLEERASTLDIRIECQDLERFSIINRFAKFHGRGHQGGVEGSSTSEATPYKIFPQRYVTAMSMSGNLPQGVACLSL